MWPTVFVPGPGRVLTVLDTLLDRDTRRSRGLLDRFGDQDRDERSFSRHAGSPRYRYDDEWWDDDGCDDRPRHRRPRREAMDWDD